MKKLFSIITICTFSFIASSQKDTPKVMLGGAGNQDTVSLAQIVDAEKIQFVNADGSVNSTYKIDGGTLIVASVAGAGRIVKDGLLDNKAKSMLKLTPGHSVVFEFRYTNDENISRIGNVKFYVLEE
ncbi:hypothetical protein K6119_10495 [Paracrocinitomix mangrovi]|uniref:hypothetical protein n=1 Tax=Paracrocinitomix mangrovi TaxID=2862509 RepID=UPI001C8E8741|nr:hypothetical protein [Paracrocinitomix mangrovi]UKN00163.1 hypothetical protein K6119_10495 [Paracrocinitomix mangrovi]